MIGQVLGQYEITEKLGGGGMGEVYKARDLKLGRDVAIKILKAERSPGGVRLARFEKEARAASALNHPNIVTVYDIGQQDGIAYIVMEYVDGETLRDRLARGPLSNEELVRYLTQISEGLAKAHQAGIVHRDLKPENVILTQDGYPKILDFGLAKLLPPDQDKDQDQGSEMATLERHGTAPGTILGTVGYMSPEQAKGESVDFRSDQFSYGAIAYEMATGRRAFQRSTAVQTLNAIIEDEPEPMGSIRSDVPSKVEAVVRRCLAKAPAARYDSTADIAAELRREESSPRAGRGPRVALAALALIALGLLAAFWAGLLRPEPTSRIESIAVLPFENLSGDPGQEYFADGMTEELIADLAKIQALKVISRTTAMQYKNAKKPLPEIARELGVDAVIEGSALKVADRVRITAQLIRGDTDQHLWAESYDRELKDVLGLQSEVARTIANEVRVTLTPQERALLSHPRSVQPAAHEAYLKGRFYWNLRSPESILTGMRYFREAIAIDPDYAPAYVGLADSQTLLAWFLIGATSPAEAIPQIQASLNRALELDDTLAEAHVISAQLASQRRDWERAEREGARAIELSPNHARAYQARGFQFLGRGRFDKAYAAFERARELDPLSLIMTVSAGIAHYMSRDYDGALALYREALELDPDFYPARIMSIWVYTQRRDWSAALREIQRGRAIGDNPAYLAKLGQVYAGMGRQAEAREVLEELTRISKNAYVDGYHFATIHLALGDHERALDALEEAFDENSTSMGFLRMDPAFDPLRSEPRFQELLRRMNFPD